MRRRSAVEKVDLELFEVAIPIIVEFARYWRKGLTRSPNGDTKRSAGVYDSLKRNKMGIDVGDPDAMPSKWQRPRYQIFGWSG